MPETTTAKPTKIEFIEYHQPALKDGDYTISIEQKIIAEEITSDNAFAVTKNFSVAGERFDLNPTNIHAVFPPSGSLGEHSNVLAHIILNRSTLPWERITIPINEGDNEETKEGKKKIPWLALLLFEAGEKPEPKIITIKDLKNPQPNAGKFPEIVGKDEKPPTDKVFLHLESGQHEGDKLTVIDVEKQLLDKILPAKEDLAYLAHVRQGTDTDGKLVGDELAIIIGNRLPKKGSISTVHLVSIEGRYNDNGFDFQGAGDRDYIRLVSLKSWSFACVDEKQDFKQLLKHLNRNPSSLRLPKVDNREAEEYLSMGYLPLPHFLRQGSKTFSWYHSPLTTGNNSGASILLPIRAADELVRYNPNNGMFDISYASAWELGRLLALQSKNFSISLYNWKRTHRQGNQIQQAEFDLPFHNQPNTALPDQIALWFNDLSLLKGVPFNYLVPDEQMLPIESIRFFWVDPMWIECLLDGAFSIGRVTTSDYKHDRSHQQSPAANPNQKVTGFLLRSDVVAGWPGLLVDGYSQVSETEDALPDSDKLELLRMERLSANVLICLFQGEVKTVDIHQKPETLHFGFDTNDESQTFYKRLKDQDGKQLTEKDNINVSLDLADTRKIDIKSLADTIKEKAIFNSFTSAQFALEMIEGVEKVRFTLQ